MSKVRHKPSCIWSPCLHPPWGLTHSKHTQLIFYGVWLDICIIFWELWTMEMDALLILHFRSHTLKWSLQTNHRFMPCDTHNGFYFIRDNIILWFSSQSSYTSFCPIEFIQNIKRSGHLAFISIFFFTSLYWLQCKSVCALDLWNQNTALESGKAVWVPGCVFRRILI